MGWQRVAVGVAGEHAQALAEALEEEGAISVDLADDDAGTSREQPVFDEGAGEASVWPRCRLSALFAEAVDVSSAFDRALLRSRTPALAAASLDRVEDTDWVIRTQSEFAPIRVGSRLWIVPTWHEPPDPGAINLVLDPGAAFGTGSHPTTKLCLAWLERSVSPATTVLDYGCGSGILGIAALKLGARAATGVDIDPLALEAAGYNAGRNAVELKVASAASTLAAAFRLTVANILANPLRMLAPLLASHTEVGGSIALSGILAPQADEVAAAYAPWATLRIEARDDDWVLIAGTRER